ncbi:MAG: hypothetical protein KA248_01405 [Kiritimatiellae bacterium]|nr:hypothetical protein [Kiritimatiellia bacterium]
MNSSTSSSDARGGLRGLALPAAVFLAVLAAGSLLLRAVYTDFPAPSVYAEARRAIGTNTELLVIGNSLTTMGVQPSRLSRRAVNLAVDGGHYEIIELILRRNIDRAPNARWALIQLDNLCYLYDRMTEERDFRQLYEMGVRRQDLVKGPAAYVRQFLTDNWLLYPIFFLDRLTPANPPERPGLRREPGFQSRTFRLTDAILAERNLLEDEFLLESKRKPQNRAALFRLIERVKARGMQPVFFRMPRMPAYTRARSAEWLAREEAMIQSVREHEGDGMILLDFRDRPGLDTTHFSDTRHLNYVGAEIFTRRLDEELSSRVPGYAREPSAPPPGEAAR